MDNQQSITYLARDLSPSVVKSFESYEKLINHFIKTPQIQALLNHLGYEFKNNDLLFKALRHRSFVHELKSFNLKSNERLEFLGDSVLSLTISEYLHRNLSDLKEGELSKLRSSLVNEKTLSELCQFHRFHECLLLGKGELSRNGYNNAASLCDLFESLMGAIYLDSNFKTVSTLIIRLYKELDESIFSENRITEFDPKSKLQEISLKHYKSLPKYQSTHDEKKRTFLVTLLINGKEIYSMTGSSKKQTEIKLAKYVLDNNLIQQGEMHVNY